MVPAYQDVNKGVKIDREELMPYRVLPTSLWVCKDGSQSGARLAHNELTQVFSIPSMGEGFQQASNFYDKKCPETYSHQRICLLSNLKFT